jgi:hypothetical protein
MTATKTVDIDPASKLGEALRRASLEHSKVIVKAGDAEYRLSVSRVPSSDNEIDEDIGEISRRAILESAGSWKGIVDAEELKAYIRERRMTPSRGGWKS